MRITIVQGAFFPIPPLLGGAVEKEWFALGKEFASRGHKVVHVSRAYENLPREEVIDGVSYKRVAGFNAVNNLTLLKLLDFLYTLRVLKELPEADILVSNTFWLPLLACNPKFGKIYVHVSRYPRGQLKLYHCASRLQAPSVAIAREIVRQEPWSKDKVCVIPYFAKERANLEAKRLSGAEKYILYVGRIHPEKGLDLLIEAFKLIIESGIKGCRLIIVGPWEIKLGGGGEGYFMQLQKQAASIRQFIDWIGPIFSEEELTRYYLGTSLFIYPSLAEKGEALPVAPLEAMGQGCPVLVSDLDCFRDYIENDKTGFIFNHRRHNPAVTLSEKIKKIMEQEEKLCQVAQNSYNKAQEFNLDRIAGRYLDDFEALLNKDTVYVGAGMDKKKFHIYTQSFTFGSPWPLKARIALLLWDVCWFLFCAWSPKPFNPWRLFWLRAFGAKIEGTPFVHQHARIQIPWNIILHDKAAIGDRTSLYSLGVIEVKARAIVAQEAYLCTGTHDFSVPERPLMTAKITIGEDAFVGARTFVMPAVSIGKSALIGACSVVTNDIEDFAVAAGNPVRVIRKRK